MKDGSRPTTNAFQREFVNRSLVLVLQSTGIERKRKGGMKPSGKCKGAEWKWTTVEGSKQYLVSKSKHILRWLRLTLVDIWLLAKGWPARKVAGTLHRLLYGTWETACWCVNNTLPESRKGKRETPKQELEGSDGSSIPIKSGEATSGVGLSHSSEEVLVMRIERRA